MTTDTQPIAPELCQCLALIEKNHMARMFGTDEHRKLARGELYMATRKLTLIEKEDMRRRLIKKSIIEHSLNELTKQ